MCLACVTPPPPPCRALVEGRDAACIERDRAVQGEKNAVRKYEELLSK